VTWDRAEAEAEVNVDVLGRNAMQQTARMAQDGAYGYSRLNNFAHVNLMHRVAKYLPPSHPHNPTLSLTPLVLSLTYLLFIFIGRTSNNSPMPCGQPRVPTLKKT